MFWTFVLFLVLAASPPLFLAVLGKLSSYRSGDMEPEIEWVSVSDMPRKALTRFEKMSPEFTRCGLEQLGILKVKHRILTMYDCYFYGSDRTSVAEVSYSHMFGFLVSSSVAVKSLLSDGTIVETSSHKELPNEIASMANERYFELNCAGTEDVAQLLQSHKRAVQNTKGEQPDRFAIELTRDIVAEATVYGLNLADCYLHKKGVLANPPRPLFGAEETATSPA